MTEMQTRIDNCRTYLTEAEKAPENNELYIADLKISIGYFENAIKHKIDSYKIMSGFNATQFD